MKRFRFSWPEGYGVPPPEEQEAGTIAKLQERYEAELKAQGEG